MGLFTSKTKGLTSTDPNPNTHTGLSDDMGAVYPRAWGKVGENARYDEREQDQRVMDTKPWDPPHAEDQLDDYTKVRPIVGHTMRQTNDKLKRLGVARTVEGTHYEAGPFKGTARDVLISARGRYYWVGAGACPFETGPNGEISRHEFETIRGLR